MNRRDAIRDAIVADWIANMHPALRPLSESGLIAAERCADIAEAAVTAWEANNPTLDLGSPGNCIPCSKAREHVRGEACLDCRVHYGTATPDERIAYDYAASEYMRGYEGGLIDGRAQGDKT